ncbi:MAG: hypothetical protein M0P69_03675 [Bacteroidales bacterium]|nr:hypothetical protein [Bacteroidales bacterium]
MINYKTMMQYRLVVKMRDDGMSYSEIAKRIPNSKTGKMGISVSRTRQIIADGARIFYDCDQDELASIPPVNVLNNISKLIDGEFNWRKTSGADLKKKVKELITNKKQSLLELKGLGEKYFITLCEWVGCDPNAPVAVNVDDTKIIIETPLKTSGLKKVIFNGVEYSLERCSSFIFSVLPGEKPKINIQYLPQRK